MKIIKYIAAIVLMFLILGCERKEEKILRPVETIIIQEETKTNSKNFSGVVISDTSPNLAFKIEGEIKKIYVMVQKEVAMRLSGKPSTKDYNSLSVFVQYYTNVKMLFNVPPKSFIPAPNVDSSVIEIIRKDKCQYVKDEKEFHKFVQNIF